MALTVTKTKEGVAGDLRYVTGTLAFDSSYPTGGESLTAANLGMSKIWVVMFPENKTGYAFEYDYTNSKVLVYSQGATTGATAAGGTTGTFMNSDAGTEGTVRLQSAGTSATVKWGPMLEFTNATTLASLSAVRFFVLGF